MDPGECPKPLVGFLQQNLGKLVSKKGGRQAMNYGKPEVVVLGPACSAIQSNKPSVGEPTLSDPRTMDDCEAVD